MRATCCTRVASPPSPLLHRNDDFVEAAKENPDLVFVRPSWVHACVAKKVRDGEASKRCG